MYVTLVADRVWRRTRVGAMGSMPSFRSLIITILDQQGLVEASCECYQLVRARVAFHLPKTYA